MYPPKPWSEINPGPPEREKQRASDLLEDPTPQTQPEVAPPTMDEPTRTEEETTQETPVGNIEQILTEIANGSSSITISELEPDGVTIHTGFKNKVLDLLEKLLINSVGYRLVTELHEGRAVLSHIQQGSYKIAIRPNPG